MCLLSRCGTTRTQKLWKAVYQIILMESDSHQGAERYRESHLIFSLCQFLWESEGTDRDKPLQARKRGEGQEVLVSCWPMLLFCHDIHLVSLKKSQEQSSPWSLMKRPEYWQRTRARGPDPTHRRLNPGARKRNQQGGTFDVVFGIKSIWNSPSLITT